MSSVASDWSTEYKGETRRAEPNLFKTIYYDKFGKIRQILDGYANNDEVRTRSGHSSNKVQPSGWKPCSNYRRSVRRVKVYPGSYTVWDDFGAKVFTFQGPPPDIANGDRAYPGNAFRVDGDNFPSDYSAEQSAAVEMLEKLKDGKAELGLALAGSIKAYEGLVGSFKRGVDFLLDVKRGRLARAFDSLIDIRNDRQLARDWLKFQYHWRPLAGDVWDAYNLTRQKLLEPKQFVSAYGSTRVTKGNRQVWYNPNGSVARNETWKGFCTYSCKCWAQVDSTILRAAAQTGLINPLSIAWDVLPWSFAVDWLIPVGRTIGILDAVKGLSFKDGYTARRGNMYCVGGYSSTRGWGGTPDGSVGYHVAKSYYARSRLTSFPKPLPWIKSPFSTEHAANALALFTVLRKR